jgi:hypothetical protein
MIDRTERAQWFADYLAAGIEFSPRPLTPAIAIEIGKWAYAMAAIAEQHIPSGEEEPALEDA